MPRLKQARNMIADLQPVVGCKNWLLEPKHAINHTMAASKYALAPRGVEVLHGEANVVGCDVAG